MGNLPQRPAYLHDLSGVMVGNGFEKKVSHHTTHDAASRQTDSSDAGDGSSSSGRAGPSEPVGKPSADSLKESDDARDDQDDAGHLQGDSSRGRSEQPVEARSVKRKPSASPQDQPHCRDRQNGVAHSRDEPAGPQEEARTTRREGLHQPPDRECEESGCRRPDDPCALRLAQESPQGSLHPRNSIARSQKCDPRREKTDGDVEQPDRRIADSRKDVTQHRRILSVPARSPNISCTL